MKRVITRVVATIAVSALLSGCFALRGFLWLQTKIVPGETAVAELTLRPGATNSTTDIPFVLVGLPEGASAGETSFTLGNANFDKHAEFGPVTKMTGDPELRDFAVSLGNCMDHGLDAALISGFVWRLRRTPAAVEDGGRIDDAAVTRVQVRSADDTPTGTPEFAFFSGRWADDGDNVPESNEVSCTGLMFTSLPVVPAEEPDSALE